MAPCRVRAQLPSRMLSHLQVRQIRAPSRQHLEVALRPFAPGSHGIEGRGRPVQHGRAPFLGQPDQRADGGRGQETGDFGYCIERPAADERLDALPDQALQKRTMLLQLRREQRPDDLRAHPPVPVAVGLDQVRPARPVELLAEPDAARIGQGIGRLQRVPHVVEPGKGIGVGIAQPDNRPKVAHGPVMVERLTQRCRREQVGVVRRHLHELRHGTFLPLMFLRTRLRAASGTFSRSSIIPN